MIGDQSKATTQKPSLDVSETTGTVPRSAMKMLGVSSRKEKWDRNVVNKVSNQYSICPPTLLWYQSELCTGEEIFPAIWGARLQCPPFYPELQVSRGLANKNDTMSNLTNCICCYCLHSRTQTTWFGTESKSTQANECKRKHIPFPFEVLTHQIDQVAEVFLNLLGRQTPHQIQGTIKLLVTLQ